MTDEIRRSKLTRIESSEQPIHSPQPSKPRGTVGNSHEKAHEKDLG